MKRFLILFSFLVLVFAGCGAEADETSAEYVIGLPSDPIESYDHASNIVPDGEESEISAEQTPTDGFLIKDKKYTYKSKNVVILNVENQTNKNYTVSIVGKYLDKDGNVLKTETQTSDQYSANYQGYFLFAPDIVFDSFVYTFETAPSNGPFYAKDIVYVFKGLNEWKIVNHELLKQGDRTKYPHICAGVNMAYKGTQQIFVRSTWVFVNEKGQIVGFGNINEPILSDPNPTFEGESHLPLYYTKEETMVWPEEFEGKITAILILNEIKPEA